MDEINDKGHKLTVQEKKAIDIFVNGAFVVLGLYILLNPGLTSTDFKNIVGLLAIYNGVRFMPR